MKRPSVLSYAHTFPAGAAVFYVLDADEKWRVTSVDMGSVFDGVSFVHGRLRPDHDILQAFDSEEELLELVKRKVDLAKSRMPPVVRLRIERQFA